MAIKVAWGDDSKTLLVNVYEGRWTLDDFYLAVRQTNALLDSVDHNVNVILDVKNSGLFPKGMMSAVRMLQQKPHVNLGVMVLLGCNIFVRVFYDTFMKIFPQPGRQVMYMVADYEDATAIFARYGSLTPEKTEHPANR